MRKRLNHFDNALNKDVGPAAVIPGDAADHDTEREADRDADKTDGQRNPCAIDDARQQIATEPVGAEQEQLPAIGRADEMEACRDEAPEQVFVALAEKAQGLVLCRVGRVDTLQIIHVEMVVVALDIGRGEPVFAKNVNMLRRRVDEVGVAGIEPVRRDDLADQGRRVHRQQQTAGDHRDAVTAQPPPHQPPLRRLVETLLPGGHRLDRHRVERRRRDVMRQRIGRRIAAPVGGIEGDVGHCRRPDCRRMRGSSAASAKSDNRTPITVRNDMNIRNEPARYMSWLRSATSNIVSFVGNAITTETMTAPEITCGSSEPISLMNGLSAMRSGYLNSAFSGRSPLARAVITYCFCSSSSRLARRRRIIAAVPAVPMTTTGIQMWAATEAALPSDQDLSR